MNIQDVNLLTEKHVYIGRGTKWGNPFHISKVLDRATTVEMFRQYIADKTDLLQCIGELMDKTLVCHCAPNHCHGNVLIDLCCKFMGA